MGFDDEIAALQAHFVDQTDDHTQESLYLLCSIAALLKSRALDPRQGGCVQDVEISIILYNVTFAHGYMDYRSLTDFATALLIIYNNTDDLALLSKAIQVRQRALNVCPSSERCSCLTKTAVRLHERYETTGEVGDLDAGVDYLEEARALAVGPEEISAVLEVLVVCLLQRSERLGSVEDLQAANIRACELRSISSLPAELSSRLARSFDKQYSMFGSLPHLNEAINHYVAAVSELPPGSVLHIGMLNFLATALQNRYQIASDASDLDRGEHYVNQAFDLLHPSIPLPRAPLHCTAGGICHSRFERSGEISDMDRAISHYRDALSLARTDDTRGDVLHNLALIFRVRFTQTNHIPDLEESLRFCREWVKLLAPGEDDLLDATEFLARTLAWKALSHQRSNPLQIHIGDFDTAVELAQNAAKGHHRNPMDRAQCLDCAASCLGWRYEAMRKHDARFPGQLGDQGRHLRVEDLDEAIQFSKEAIALAGGNSDRSVAYTGNLVALLRERAQAKGGTEDIAEAIAVQRKLTSSLPEGHRFRSQTLHNLSQLLSSQLGDSSRPEDFDELVPLFRSVMHEVSVGNSSRLDTAVSWAHLARSHDHDSALEAYRWSLKLLMDAITISPTLEMQHNTLRRHFLLAVDAVSYAIGRGELRLAVEMLEQGRGLLWSQIRRFRTPLDDLQESQDARAITLAAKFKEVSSQLETLATSTVPGHQIADSTLSLHSADTVTSMLARRRQLATELEETVQQTRTIPGFQHFLQLIPFDSLRLAAAQGPVIVINTSRYRSDALIVLRDMDPVCVPLSADLDEDILAATMRLVEARDGSNLSLKPTAYKNALEEAMELSWEHIVGPVVEKLKELGVAKHSRIWWCPTQATSILPLHAAGPMPGHRSKYLLDIYISSYTPTLTALIDARRGSPSQGDRRLLLVAQPGDPSLQNVADEVATILSVAPPSLAVDLLLDEQATRDSVSEALRRDSWVHFACHGVPEYGSPMNSSFKLHDEGKLTLLNIVKLHLPSAEFAFLSACSTADNSVTQATDESLYLAAALHFCGYRSVVGTMWQMNDADGSYLSESFYREMFSARNISESDENSFGADPCYAAEALNKAVKKLRKKKVGLERWVNFIHIGI